ncbi:hypothetical protein PILCRDRAFT_383247 [Piloderma croceum F 1598]|uniref:Uncharacterized protein n=1 Tax=Piloderma croceum (strain F 1598) TaxID=765440 RepID=A0A0C3FXX7_PILCF|nr:hypothetical protein PILCRDRAFT_383247 [Piloderma croceum F 1598]
MSKILLISDVDHDRLATRLLRRYALHIIGIRHLYSFTAAFSSKDAHQILPSRNLRTKASGKVLIYM